MAQAKANKDYKTFVKGLVTEASPLTYPEDASYDELNTILSRKGSRTRRLGITYATQPMIGTFETNNYEFITQEFVWKAVGQNANTNFLVVVKGSNVRFYDLGVENTSISAKSFTIDLTDYKRPLATIAELRREPVQMTYGKGYLFIVSDAIEPIYVEYDKDTDDITVNKIVILIRDFDGLNDFLANDAEPTTLSKEHHYNLMNQGWVTGKTNTNTFSPVSFNGYIVRPDVFYYDRRASTLSENYYSAAPTESPIFKFHSEIGRYPGNNKQWWVARAEADDPDKGITAGDFLPKILDSLFSGNNSAPKGHYIFDAFNKDRSALSGISDIAPETTEGRPNAVTFFSGRAWYGQGSDVYFSQILDSSGAYKAGFCYQEADPTAEDISDLIDSDGGHVPIPEIDKIVRLMPMANGVLVFAMNGVWFISGGDAAFSATNISVSKISPIGTKSPFSIVETDGTLFWWSETGIQAMQQASGQFGPIPGKFGNTSISEQTVQSYYDLIPETSKKHVKVCYDTRNNRILWLFSRNYLEDNYRYDTVLLYDMTLQAFFPWEFGTIEDGPEVTGIYLDVGYSQSITSSEVVDGNNYVVDGGVQVVVEESLPLVKPSSVYYTVNVPGEGFTVAQTVDEDCVDWVSFDTEGVTYESFLETGYELMGDAMRKKQVIYMFAHFRQDPNTSCTFQSKWDWGANYFSNKWGSSFEAYRERIRPDSSTQDLDGFAVVSTKNKVRGSGKALQFKFGTSERGKNFDLLGWSVAFSGNTEP